MNDGAAAAQAPWTLPDTEHFAVATRKFPVCKASAPPLKMGDGISNPVFPVLVRLRILVPE